MEGQLRQLASLLAQRNSIDDTIATLIGRPATPGHIGEFIAAAAFDIDRYSLASYKAADGNRGLAGSAQFEAAGRRR